MEWIQELLKHLSPETLLFIVLVALSLLSRLVQYVGVVLRKVTPELPPEERSQEERRESSFEPMARKNAELNRPRPIQPSASVGEPVPEPSARTSAPRPERPTLETLAEKMIREIEWAMKESSDETPPRNAPTPPPAPAQATPKPEPTPSPVLIPKPIVASSQPASMRGRSALPPRRSKSLPVRTPTPPEVSGHVIQVAADGRRLTSSGIEIQTTAVIQETRFDHLAVLRSPEDIQKAVLLHEILSPPVSMRRHGVLASPRAF
jgi:hypothetical protein